MATESFAMTSLASPGGSLVLQVDGVDLPVVQYVDNWAINEIPTAICAIAVGVDLARGSVSAIHTDRIRALLQDGADAIVIFSPVGESSPGVSWPQGQHVIFRGQIAGIAANTAAGRSTITVHLVHWLAKLAESSALTAVGHVGNPTAMNTLAVLGLSESGVYTGTTISGYYPLLDIEAQTSSDVWAVIYSIFSKLAGQQVDNFLPEGDCRASGVGDTRINSGAIESLERINKAMQSRKYNGVLTPGGGAPGIPPEVFDVIADSFGQATLSQFANTTFWDKLITEYCPALLLSVIPRVEDALLVPSLPAIDVTPWRVLPEQEFSGLGLSGTVERPLRGVGVVVGNYSSAIAGVSGVSPSQLGGCFVYDPDAAGTFLAISSPSWLSRLSDGLYTDANAVVDFRNLRTRKPSPAAGAQAQGKVGPARSPTAVNRLFTDYAEAFYWNHTYRGRGGTVGGPLRFDITPGSTVGLSSPKARGLTDGIDTFSAPLLGYVQRITTALDTSAPSASTTYQVSHIRPPGMGASQHPLFPKAPFRGAPLLDEYLVFSR